MPGPYESGGVLLWGRACLLLDDPIQAIAGWVVYGAESSIVATT